MKTEIANTLVERVISQGTAIVNADELRNYRADQVKVFFVATDDFMADGYRRGRHLSCVPCREGEAQDGDEVIVEYRDRLLIRVSREHPGSICLDHLQNHSPSLYLLARDVKWLYRVVG